jgi:hypothetical protein
VRTARDSGRIDRQTLAFVSIALAILASGADASCQEGSERAAGERPPSSAEARRLERRAEQLREIRELEGGGFSQEKLDRYRDRKVAGIVLVATAPALLVTSLVFSLRAMPGGFYEEYPTTERTDEERRYLIAGWVTFSSSVACFVVGLPLLINGHRGVKRQRLLQTEGESTQTVEFIGVSFALGAASGDAVAGMSARFTF